MCAFFFTFSVFSLALARSPFTIYKRKNERKRKKTCEGVESGRGLCSWIIRHDVVEPILLECDQVYHLACPASPVHYKFNPVKTIKTNVIGTMNMLGKEWATGVLMTSPPLGRSTTRSVLCTLTTPMHSAPRLALSFAPGQARVLACLKKITHAGDASL